MSVTKSAFFYVGDSLAFKLENITAKIKRTPISFNGRKRCCYGRTNKDYYQSDVDIEFRDQKDLDKINNWKEMKDNKVCIHVRSEKELIGLFCFFDNVSIEYIGNKTVNLKSDNIKVTLI